MATCIHSSYRRPKVITLGTLKNDLHLNAKYTFLTKGPEEKGADPELDKRIEAHSICGWESPLMYAYAGGEGAGWECRLLKMEAASVRSI